MKAICFSKLLSLTVFAGLILMVPGAVYSQAPPGPVPAGQPQPVPASEARLQKQSPAPPRTTILGAWKFNAEESDDRSKRRQDSRGSNGGGNGGGRGRMGGSGRGRSEERRGGKECRSRWSPYH